jgi:hypothetical protein
VGPAGRREIAKIILSVFACGSRGAAKDVSTFFTFNEFSRQWDVFNLEEIVTQSPRLTRPRPRVNPGKTSDK